MCTFFLEWFMRDFMKDALAEAKIAYNNNEVPVGAIIVKDNKIISKAHNLKRNSNNIMNHAEIIAIMEASEYLGDWRLNDCDMYVTLEPCPMCAGAINQSRIRKLYIGSHSNILCNEKIIRDILQNDEYNHKVEIEYLKNKDCSEILTTFFVNKR